MTLSSLVTVLAVLLGAVAVLGPWALATANRLDRLHVRTDAAWAALDAALARRAVVARVVAAVSGSKELRAAADRAEVAAKGDREAVENELAPLLAGLDRDGLPSALAAELVDAEQRVVLARRVHNDAVRDTLALRRRRSVRWLHLAGTAPTPGYFEIAEPEPEAEPGAPRKRVAARVLLLDERGRLLLFEGFDPSEPGELFWFTVGGAVERGEDLRAAAVREAREETGFELDPEALVGPVWVRRKVLDFGGTRTAAEEWFFVARVDGGRAVDVSGFQEYERDTITRHRWWTVEELTGTDELVYPRQLGELLPGAAAGEWDGTTRPIQ
ncbi:MULTISPECIES: NUDIX hydrolase [Actinosynnema]|uniref:NUDIX hydrolase n=1 Tax=Actinosynnema TaxID=40566 RepID=UPI0020A4D46E|nr:NUDIX domain-containing protein [Actinosynnema pretiosum]MCP2097201.1 hypothetical protein [Actinosynnema pretiosum]